MSYRFHKTRQYESSLAKVLAGGVFTLACILLAWLWLAEKPDRVRKPLPEMTLAPKSGAAASVADKTKPFRLVYRNSVIPGGVHSAAELATAVQRDAVIKAHYANFDVAAAQLVQVKQSRLVHVSYRIGDQIYWTKNKVRLALGEELLSDGTHLVRARCGNRIADEPEGPVLDNEPAPEVLDAVFVSADDLIDPSASMKAVSTVGASPPVVAATTTQVVIPGIASNLHSEALFPALGSPDRWGQRTPAQSSSTSVVSTDKVSFGSALVERHEPDVSVTPSDPEGGVPKPPKRLDPTPAVTPTQIPEPGSTALFGLTLVVLALVRRRPGRSECD